MSLIEIFFYIIEIIGVFAAAVSGALVAIERGLDLFGVFVLAATTALGGGIIRDLILGRTPPVAFRNPTFFIVAFCGTVFFLLVTRLIANFFNHLKHSTFRFLINFFDAIGLAVFCIVGVNAAFQTGFQDNLFLAVFTGVITGIGGGMLRDVLANRTPIVLRKEIYALAAIIGCIFYAVIWNYIPKSIAMLASIVLIIFIRMISLKMNLGVQLKKNEAGKISIKFRD